MLGTAIFEVVEAEGGQFFKSLEFGPEKNMFKFKDLFLNPLYRFALSNAFFFQISLIRHYFIHVQRGLSSRF